MEFNSLIISFTLACYLYGAIPFAFIGTYLIKKEKIYELGSKNVGVANTFSVAGMIPGLIAVIGEISKAIVPLLLSYLYLNPDITKSFVGFILGQHNKNLALLLVGASFIGTNYSIFIKFRGGMGNTINMWMLLLLSPISLLLTSGIVILLRIFKRSYTNAIRSSEKTKYLLPFVLFLGNVWTEWRWSFLIYGFMVSIVYYLKRKQNKAEIRVTLSRTFHPSAKLLKDYYKNHPRYVYYIEEIGSNRNIGSKAENICKLNRMGFLVPDSIIITYEAYNEYKSDKTRLMRKLESELEGYIREEKIYSVRSSANLEDGTKYSFAGQFLTFLDVQGLSETTKRISEIWNNAENENYLNYNDELANNRENLQMAIIIQEMVDAKFSGVVFTKDPVYNLNEIIIEVVDGLGPDLVQKGITPVRYVYKWDQWVNKPDENRLQILKEIVNQSKKIEKKYGKPVDLEFSYDGNDIFWLQLRNITSLDSVKLYSNKMAKEMLPGLIKPLIFSMNISVVNSAWKNIFIKLIGSSAKKINIEDLGRSFYYRVYFNMSIIGDVFQLLGLPRDSLELLAGIHVEGLVKPKMKPSLKMMRYFHHMLLFFLSLFSLSKKLNKHMKLYYEKYEKIQNVDIESQNLESCLEYIDELLKLNRKSSYYVILSQLINSIYSRIVSKKIENAGYSFESIDLGLLNPKLKDYEFKYDLIELNSLFKDLHEDEKRNLLENNFEEVRKKEENLIFMAKFDEFLENFGYLRESGNDFSYPSWYEDPAIVMKMMVNQHPSASKNYSNDETHKIFDEIFSSLTSKRILRNSLKYQEYRITVNSLYLLGYGLFRPFFLRIGEIFVKKGFLAEVDDVFYLTYPEIQEKIHSGQFGEPILELIEKRKSEMIKYQKISLPQIIYDDVPPEPLYLDDSCRELNGVATSRGIYKGPVKVAHHLTDIEKIDEGDVLVIPYSDISWTPLFSKAKAVISESGGLLSHSSIVAREYKIPAVVSVDGAMLLEDNTMVVVDGFTGKISIIKEVEKEEKEFVLV